MDNAFVQFVHNTDDPDAPNPPPTDKVLGRYLDEKNNSEPWFFLGLTGIAVVISTVGIGIVATKYIKQIERENKKKKDLTKK